MSKLGAQEQALMQRIKAGGFRPASEIPLAESRNGLTQMAIVMAGPKAEVGAISDRKIPGPGGDLPIRIYRPEGHVKGLRPVALYFHGGGFYLGNLETHDHVCRFLCKNSGVIVIAVDYRLAPEHKFPAAIEDCYAALCWTAENAAKEGFDANRVALVGDSAGGTIVVSVCLMARQKGGPKIAYQVSVYPALTVDDGEDFPSRRALGSGEYFIAHDDFAFFRQLYLENPDRDAQNPLASPIRAKDYAKLPSALVIAAEFDPCVDEDAYYAERLKADGVDTEYVCFKGTLHPFFLFDGVLDAGRQGQKLVAERVRTRLKVG